ncbi:MAG: hypothetical protein DRP45_00405 [Candidatus Zixiibacteriota bacterium]|nr:MAG: hypothetical protein DRP45_00405 [candidate division Zixibacteria bacterium]
MNCEQVQQQLELLFGSSDLPKDILAHVEECSACRAFNDELAELGGRFQNDTGLELSEIEIERAVANVAARIEPRDERRLSPRWLTGLSRVAAALFIVTISYGAYTIGQQQASDDWTSAVSTGQQTGDNLVYIETDEEAQMDNELVTVLIQDFSSGRSFDAGETLLGDITVEEMEYLVENMNVGELL